MAGTTLMTEEAMNADSREAVREIVEGLRDLAHAHTQRLAKQDWRPTRSHYEADRNALAGTARALEAALSTPPPPEPLSREGVASTDAINERIRQQREHGLDALYDWLKREAAANTDTGYQGAFEPSLAQLEGWAKSVLLAKDIAKRALAQTHPVSSPGEGWREAWKPTVMRAIADGFTEGNEPYEQATVSQQARYEWAADAVLDALSASPAQPARQQDQGRCGG